jgi:ABC-type sugar transport system ATPase subunit
LSASDQQTLRVEHLAVVYPRGARPALDDVSLTIDGARTLAVVGPSGAGKSTLLRAIAGLVGISRGTIELNGRDVSRDAPQERRIAIVFAEDALLAHRTLERNLAFVARDPSQIDDIIDTLGIGAHRGRRPSQLSSGQRRRVSIARALLAQPHALLLDEPLAPLDPELRALVREELLHVRARFDGPMIFVTHDHADAMTVADTLAVLIDGRIEDSGEPQRVYDRPRTVRVAALLGTRPMNLLPGAIFGLDPDTIVGVRPERVRLAGDGAIRGEVRRVERTGADGYIHVVGEAASIVARVLASDVVAVGTTVACAFADEDIRMFDRVTGCARS